MSEHLNIENTQAIYTAVPAGDLDTAVSLLDPEIRITYYGSDVWSHGNIAAVTINFV